MQKTEIFSMVSRLCISLMLEILLYSPILEPCGTQKIPVTLTHVKMKTKK